MKSPVLENCTPGSVRGALGNQRPYLAKILNGTPPLLLRREKAIWSLEFGRQTLSS